MAILEEIISKKKSEVSRQKELVPFKALENSIYFRTPVVSLRHYLTRPGSSGIIAEIKRRSPSKGVINQYISVEQLSIGYMQAGAAALSVLTDSGFFGGSSDDLKTARRFNFCPILRKEFIIDTYQVIEAKSIGADAILLIAAVLEPAEAASLASIAHETGLEVLLEVHSKEELESHFCDSVDLVGVNNRNLDTLEISLQTSLNLAPLLPKDRIWVTESGISTVADMITLRNAGFAGFLIGSQFMKHSRPETACEEFIKEVRTCCRS